MSFQTDAGKERRSKPRLKCSVKLEASPEDLGNSRRYFNRTNLGTKAVGVGTQICRSGSVVGHRKAASFRTDLHLLPNRQCTHQASKLDLRLNRDQEREVGSGKPPLVAGWPTSSSMSEKANLRSTRRGGGSMPPLATTTITHHFMFESLGSFSVRQLEKLDRCGACNAPNLLSIPFSLELIRSTA